MRSRPWPGARTSDRRFAQVRRAYADHDSGADSDYAELTQSWDRLTVEDLDTAEDIDVA